MEYEMRRLRHHVAVVRPAGCPAFAGFADEPHGVLELIKLRDETDERLEVGELLLAPALRQLEHYPPSLIAVVDKEHAKTFGAILDDIIPLQQVDGLEVRHTRAGGTSAPSNQRKADNRAKANLENAVKTVEREIASGAYAQLYLAGPAEARTTFEKMLPERLKKKLVFDSMVVVPMAPSGRLSSAHAAPAESASAMSTPPWRIPAAVHSDGAHASDMTTSSAVYASVSMPRVAARGMSSRTTRVASRSAMHRILVGGGEHEHDRPDRGAETPGPERLARPDGPDDDPVGRARALPGPRRHRCDCEPDDLRQGARVRRRGLRGRRGEAACARPGRRVHRVGSPGRRRPGSRRRDAACLRSGARRRRVRQHRGLARDRRRHRAHDRRRA